MRKLTEIIKFSVRRRCTVVIIAKRSVKLLGGQQMIIMGAFAVFGLEYVYFDFISW